MKKLALAAALTAAACDPPLPAAMSEPIIEPEIVVEEAAGFFVGWPGRSAAADRDRRRGCCVELSRAELMGCYRAPDLRYTSKKAVLQGAAVFYSIQPALQVLFDHLRTAP